MHIGFRYHVASLVAVFFSLVLGMLVGSALFQDDRLVQEQGHIIGDLETRFKSMELRTQVLQDDLEFAKQREAMELAGWDQLRQVFIRERLSNRDVVFFSLSMEVNWQRLTDLMIEAGATVVKSVNIMNEKEWQQVNQLVDISTQSHPPLAVVWVNKALDKPQVDMIHHLREKGFVISLVQPVSCTASLYDLSKDYLVVDHGDSPLGELTLVLGFVHSLVGNYGLSTGSLGLLPALDWEDDIL